MKQLTDGVRDAQFEAWWEKSGQFCRSGGGAYEKTFAYTAWLAALDTAQTVQVNAMLVEALEKLQRHDFEMRSKTGDGFAPYVVRIIDDALTAAQQAQPERAPLSDSELEQEFCNITGLETGINPAAADTKRALVWFKKGYAHGIKQGGQQ